MTVHMLKSGLAVCGAGMPNDWPDGDRWVAYNNKSDRGSVNCQGCLAPPGDLGPAGHDAARTQGGLMGDHIEHECRRCGSLLHYEDKCPCKQCGLIHNPEHSCTPAVDLCELCKHPQHAGRCGHMISGSRGGQFDCGHTVPSVHGESPITTHHKQAVKDRDAALFALKALVRAMDDDVTYLPPHIRQKEHAAALELLTALCPGCRGRYTETDKHTCVREGD